MEVEGSGRPMFEVERFLANEGKKTFILDLFHLICCGHQWSINHSHTYLTDLSICLSWSPYFLLFIFYFLFFIMDGIFLSSCFCLLFSMMQFPGIWMDRLLTSEFEGETWEDSMFNNVIQIEDILWTLRLYYIVNSVVFITHPFFFNYYCYNMLLATYTFIFLPFSSDKKEEKDKWKPL